MIVIDSIFPSEIDLKARDRHSPENYDSVVSSQRKGKFEVS